MPTDNPKISLYVPQQIYDRFKEFQEERKLSMSQAGIVVLAEYFGLEETIKEFTEGTTIGGVTLSEFENLKQRVKELQEQVNLNRSVIDKLPDKNEYKDVEHDKSTSKPLSVETNDNSENIQLSLDSSSTENTNLPTFEIKLLAKRLGFDSIREVSKNSRRYKNEPEKFCNWSKKKDPDGIAWVLTESGYSPNSGLSNKLLSKLRDWIAGNT